MLLTPREARRAQRTTAGRRPLRQTDGVWWRQRARLRLPTQSLPAAVLFLAPFLLLLGTFQHFAVVSAVANSLRTYSTAGVAVGGASLENYQSLAGDTAFLESLVLSLGFAAIKVPMQIAIGLGIALLVSRPGRLNALVRSSLFLPMVTPIVVVSLLFTFLFDRELGIVNAALALLGAGRPAWLLEPRLAQLILLLLSLWRDTGFVMLVFLAGLQAVPVTILEAARLDGASPWQELRHVTVPLLGRSFQFAIVFCTLTAVQLASPIAIITQGGPRGATDLVGYHIYREAFDFFDWGRASAMSVVVVVLLLILTGFQLHIFRSRWSY